MLIMYDSDFSRLFKSPDRSLDFNKIREVGFKSLHGVYNVEFKMDSLNRAGARNFSNFFMGDCVLNEMYVGTQS